MLVTFDRVQIIEILKGIETDEDVCRPVHCVVGRKVWRCLDEQIQHRLCSSGEAKDRFNAFNKAIFETYNDCPIAVLFRFLHISPSQMQKSNAKPATQVSLTAVNLFVAYVTTSAQTRCCRRRARSSSPHETYAEGKCVSHARPHNAYSGWLATGL